MAGPHRDSWDSKQPPTSLSLSMGRTDEQHGHAETVPASPTRLCPQVVYFNINLKSPPQKSVSKQRLRGKNHLSPFLSSTKDRASAATD